MMDTAVSLKRAGNLVALYPVRGMPVEELYNVLRTELCYELRVRNDWKTRQALGGKKFRCETQLLCSFVQTTSTPHIVFPAGMFHRVTSRLNQLSVAWDFVNLRPSMLGKPVIERMDMRLIRPDQRRALAAIFTSDMGVIDAPTGIGKTFLICQICRAYPKAKIIVSTYKADVAASIFSRMKEYVPFNELGRVGGGHKSPSRVTIATVNSLAHAGPEACELLLYDEVHEVGAPKRAAGLGLVRNAHMFGFSASSTGRSDGSDLVIEALFGPVIYKMKYQEAESCGLVATIKVAAIDVPGVPIPFDDDVAKERFGLWRNDVRNKLIAEAAAVHATSGKQVLINVDKVEHALYLRARYLPTWPIVHGPVMPEQVRTFAALGVLPKGDSWLCTSKLREMYRERFESGGLRYAIATGVWSQGVDFRHLDVLVRADGKSGVISSTQWPGRLSRGKVGLLIDFDDVFDPQFAERSKRRFRTYRGHGWEIQRYERYTSGDIV